MTDEEYYYCYLIMENQLDPKYLDGHDQIAELSCIAKGFVNINIFGEPEITELGWEAIGEYDKSQGCYD